MASKRLTILIIVAASSAITGCERHGAVGTTAADSPTTKRTAEAPGLKAGMTDAEIVRACGLDPSSAKREFVQGKDGTSATYSAGDQRVTVTRSLVSGVTVSASGRVSGVWPLGQP
jgi:hypothetical protein